MIAITSLPRRMRRSSGIGVKSRPRSRVFDISHHEPRDDVVRRHQGMVAQGSSLDTKHIPAATWGTGRTSLSAKALNAPVFCAVGPLVLLRALHLPHSNPKKVIWPRTSDAPRFYFPIVAVSGRCHCRCPASSMLVRLFRVSQGRDVGIYARAEMTLLPPSVSSSPLERPENSTLVHHEIMT